MTSGEALRLLRESRDGLRIFAPGEVEQLAAMAGVGVTVVRVDLTQLATERIEIAPPPGSDAASGGARNIVAEGSVNDGLYPRV